jgi:hypothetical protein
VVGLPAALLPTPNASSLTNPNSYVTNLEPPFHLPGPRPLRGPHPTCSQNRLLQYRLLSLQANAPVAVTAELAEPAEARTERSNMTLKTHPLTIQRSNTSRAMYYDKYTYNFELNKDVDLAYLKAKYTTKNNGMHHIIQSMESKTELSIVVCKECFENERQLFARCVNKQSPGRYSNWIVTCNCSMASNIKLLQ